MQVLDETTATSWITTGEASRRLRMSPQWTRQMATRGTIRTMPTALGLLIDPESVDELVRARAAGSRDLQEPA